MVKINRFLILFVTLLFCINTISAACVTAGCFEGLSGFAKNSNAGHTPDNLVDGSLTSDYWQQGTAEQSTWFAMQNTTAFVANNMTIWGYNPTFVLENFVVQVSNDSTNGANGNWSTIHTVIGNAQVIYNFGFTNTDPHNWYRVVVSKWVNSAGKLAINESELFFNAAVPITPPITSNLSQFYNTTNISIQLNTISNVNMSYVLDGGLETTICTDCNNSILNLTSLSEILHNIMFVSTDSNGQENVTENFTNDYTQPSIVQIGNISEGSFEVNFSDVWNISDALSGIANCTINITELENVSNPDNFLINCNDTQVFSSAGLHNAFVRAFDNAGNINTTSLNFTIVPFIFVFFNDSMNGSRIFTYNATIFHPDGRITFPIVNVDGSINLSPVNNGSLDLGLHTIQFEKQGFITMNFSLIVNESSDFNVTYLVDPAEIIIRIFDRTTLSLLTQLVNVNILGLGNQTTTNGTMVFQNFSLVSGNYLAQAFSAGYYTAEKTFTYNNQAIVFVDMYLLNESAAGSTTLVVPVIDEFFNVIQDSDTRLLQYDPSVFGFIEVGQCFTNSNGECKFLIEAKNKTYIIRTSKTIGNVLFTAQSSEDGEIFLEDIADGVPIPGEIFLRQLVLTLSSNLDTPSSIGLTITAPANVNETIVSKNDTSTVVSIPTSFSTDTGLSYTVCLEVYRVSGTSFIQEFIDCATGSSGIIPVVNIILNNDFDYEARVTVDFDNSKGTYKTYLYPNDKSFINLLLEQDLVNPVVVFFWVALLSLSLYLRSLGLWVKGAWFLSVVQLAMFTNYLVASSSVIIILINIGVLYISKRTGDTI